MRRILAALPTLLRVSIANMIQYRAEIALWALWGIVSPVVLMAVWSAAARHSDSPGHIGRLATGQMLAYFYMTMVIGHLTAAWDVYEMGWAVRTGRMSPLLLRPILPVWTAAADNIAYKIVTLVILAPIWAVLAYFIRPQFDTRSEDLLFALAAVPLAAILNFISGYVLALMAFFVTKMDAVGEFYFGAAMFFGGRLAPIHLLPGPMKAVALAMPYRWIYAYPSELLAGQLDRSAAINGLLWQIGWIVVGIGVFQFMWTRGVKRYSAVGA